MRIYIVPEEGRQLPGLNHNNPPEHNNSENRPFLADNIVFGENENDDLYNTPPPAKPRKDIAGNPQAAPKIQ